MFVAIQIPDHCELTFDTDPASVREVCRAHSLTGLGNRIDDLIEAERTEEVPPVADAPVILQLRKGALDALRGAGVKVERHGGDVS